jgi:hypothetical protein
MEFINRKRELEFLHNAYEEKRSHFIVIYGKRRVGKTTLVKEFFRDIPHIYFLADKAPEGDQLRLLSEKVALMFNDEFLLSRGFGNWHEFFRYIKDRGRIVVVIDEFPFLIEANRAIPSIFQKGWDEELKDSEIFLVLSGSSMGMMETEVLGYKSPLFGRRTGQLQIQPFDFPDSKKFFPDLTTEDFIYIFSVLGGVPAYLKQFNRSDSLWTNIKEKILKPEAYLYAEPEFILREELREPRNYFSILRALSLGKTRVSEIINETGFEKNIVGKYLSVLTDLKIITREVPVTEKSYEKSKKGIYTLSDNFFRFWFRFVFPNRSFIEEGQTGYVVEKKIKPVVDLFVSGTFEEVCRDYVRKGYLQGLRFNKVGRWWSRNAEIDVVALNEDDGIVLFGETKWSRKKVGTDILSDLKEKAEKVPLPGQFKTRYLALFSRKGFTADLKRIAREEGVVLVGVEEM